MLPIPRRTQMKQAKSTGTLRKILSVLFCTLLLSLGASLVFAQENTGAIQGTVKDATGAAIPGAKVTASSPTLVRPLDVTTDSEGNYLFPKVPAGIYTISVTQSGFKTVKSEDVNVVLGNTARIDVALTAGNVSESVTVTAGSELIDVTSSKIATNITPEFIDKTPKGRNFHSILVVAPGVRSEPKAGNSGTGTSGGVGGFSINGASG